MGISIIGKALSTITFFMAWWLYKPPATGPETCHANAVAVADTVPVKDPKDPKEAKELSGIDNPAADLS